MLNKTLLSFYLGLLLHLTLLFLHQQFLTLLSSGLYLPHPLLLPLSLLLYLFQFEHLFRQFGMSLDVLATLQQVVPLSAHEIQSTGQGVLDEIVLARLIGDTLDGSLNVELRQTVVDDISGEEIDAPGKSLLDLRRSFPVIFCLPRANFPVVFSYRPVPALSLLLLVGMAALDLVLAVRTPRLPPVQQGIRAKFYTLG